MKRRISSLILMMGIFSSPAWSADSAPALNGASQYELTKNQASGRWVHRKTKSGNALAEAFEVKNPPNVTIIEFSRAKCGVCQRYAQVLDLVSQRCSGAAKVTEVLDPEFYKSTEANAGADPTSGETVSPEVIERWAQSPAGVEPKNRRRLVLYEDEDKMTDDIDALGLNSASYPQIAVIVNGKIVYSHSGAFFAAGGDSSSPEEQEIKGAEKGIAALEKVVRASGVPGAEKFACKNSLKK